MQSAVILSTTSEDIEFRCFGCKTVFVVDSAAAGQKTICQNCGQPITIPHPASGPAAPKLAASDGINAKRADLQRQLKENQSQRTEIFGYINQLSIQLHRWQLRLQKLIEREKQIEAELSLLL